MTTSDWILIGVAAALAIFKIVSDRLLRPKHTCRPHPMVFRPDHKTWTFSDVQEPNEDDYTYVERKGDPVTVVIKDIYTYESPGPGDIIQRDNMQRYVVLRRSAASYGYLGHQYTLLLHEKSMENP